MMRLPSHAVLGRMPVHGEFVTTLRLASGTAAIVPPSVMVGAGLGGRRLARSFSRSVAAENLQHCTANFSPYLRQPHCLWLNTVSVQPTGANAELANRLMSGSRTPGGVMSIISAGVARAHRVPAR